MDDLDRIARCEKGSLSLDSNTCRRCEELDEEVLRKFATTLNIDANVTHAELCVRVADAIDRRVNQSMRASQLQLPRNFLDLPADILRRILTQLDVTTLLMACQTNEQVRAICNDPRLWKLIWDARFPMKTEIMRTSNDAELLKKEFLSYARNEAKVWDFHMYSYDNDEVEFPIPLNFANYMKKKQNQMADTRRFYFMMRDDLRAALAQDNTLLDSISKAWEKDKEEGNDVGPHFEAAFNDAFVREDVLQVGEIEWSMTYAPLLQVTVQDEIQPNRLSTNVLCNLDLLQNTIFVDDSLALPPRLLSGDIIVGDNLTYWYVQQGKDGVQYVPFSGNTLPQVAWERVKEMGVPASFWNTPLIRAAEMDPGDGVSTYPGGGGYRFVLAPPWRNLERYPDTQNNQISDYHQPLISPIGSDVDVFVYSQESMISPVDIAYPSHELSRKVASIVSTVCFPFDGCIPLLRYTLRSQVESAVVGALVSFPLCTPEVMASLVFQKPIRNERQWVMETAYRVGTDEEYDAATTDLVQYLRDTWYNDEWWDQGWKMDPWWAFLNAIKKASKGPGELARGSAINFYELEAFRSLRDAFLSRTLTRKPASLRNMQRKIEKFASQYSLHTQVSDDNDEASQAFLASEKWKTEDLPYIMSLVPANAYWISSLASLLVKLNLSPETTVEQLSELLKVEAENVTPRRADAAMISELASLEDAPMSDGTEETSQRVLGAVRRVSGASQLVALNAILGLPFPHIVYPCSMLYTPRLIQNVLTDIPDFVDLFENTAANMAGYRKRLARYEDNGLSTATVKKSITAVQREYEDAKRLLNQIDNFTPILYKVWGANADDGAKPPSFTIIEKQLANAILQLQTQMSEAQRRQLVLREPYPALVDNIVVEAQAYHKIQREWVALAVKEEDERSESLDMLRKLTGLRLAPTKDEVQRQLAINLQRTEDDQDEISNKYENVIGEDDIEDETLQEMLDAYNANRPHVAVEIWNRALAERDRPRQVANPNLEQEELAAALGGAEEIERARREERQILGIAPPIQADDVGQ